MGWQELQALKATLHRHDPCKERNAYLDSLPLLVKEELQRNESLHDILELLLCLLHGRLLPESAATPQSFAAPSWSDGVT